MAPLSSVAVVLFIFLSEETVSPEVFVISEELSSSVLSKSAGTWSEGSESSPELSVSLSSVVFVLDEIPVSGSVVS